MPRPPAGPMLALMERPTIADLSAAPLPRYLLACELYHLWRMAFEEAERALRAWSEAPVDRRAEAYAAYRSAAEREDEAAARWLRA